MVREIPLGLKIISIIDVLIGLYYLGMSFFWFFSAKIEFLGLILYIFFYVIVIWIGISTIRLKPKSLLGNKIISAVGIMAALGSYGVLAHEKEFLGRADKVMVLLSVCSIAVVYFISVLAYLKRSEIKQLFKKPRS